MQSLELSILNALQALHTPLGDAVMPALSFLGTGGWFWIALGLALLVFKRTRKTGVAVLLALLMAHTLGNGVLKPIIARTRPYLVNPDVILLTAPEKSFSFPSGHAIIAFAAAAAIWISERRAGWAALILAAAVAFSRLYLYLHFPSDVLTGAALGVLCGWVAHRLTDAGLRWIAARSARAKRSDDEMG